MIIDKIYVSSSRPSTTNILWVKPLANGEFALYAFLKGRWSLLRTMKSGGTLSPDDDTPEEMDAILGDILGIDAEGIAELKALVEDKDLLTGILPELKKKANLDSDNVFTGKATFQDKNQRDKIIIKDGEVISPAPGQEEDLSVRLSDAELRFYNNDSSYGDCQVAVNYSSYQGNKHLSVNTKIGDAYDEETLAYLSDIPAVTPQVQSDWNEADNTKKSFINNKPTIPTNTSDLNNDSKFVSEDDIEGEKAPTTETLHIESDGAVLDSESKLVSDDDSNFYVKPASETTVTLDTNYRVNANIDLVEGNQELCRIHIPDTGILHGSFGVNNLSSAYISFKVVYTNSNNELITMAKTDREGWGYYTWDTIVGSDTPIDVKGDTDIIVYTAMISADTNANVEFSTDILQLVVTESKYVIPTKTSDLTNDSGFLTQHQDISGKADKSEMSVVPGTGADVGKTTITLKQGTSATVLTAHQDISGKENVMPITTATGETLSAVVGNYYRLNNVGTLAITLPTITGATKLQSITFLLICGSSALVTFVPQGSETILKQEDFSLEADTTYEVTALWNGSEWTLSRVIYE